MPELSVIVPVYNTKSYLPECVNSILHQSFSDFELILIDDGSTDGSGALCDDFAAADARVKVLHQQNLGQAAARNNGVLQAKAELLCFIDSDDAVHPSLLELFLKAYRENGVGAVASDRINAKEPPADFYTQKEAPTELMEINENTLISLLQKNDTLYWTLFPCLLKKSIYEAFPLTPGHVMEDNAITPTWLWAAGRIAVLRAPLYFYRQNPTGTMQAELNAKNLDFLWALEQQLAFCETQGCSKLQGEVAREYVLSALYLSKRFRREKNDKTTEKRIVKKAVRLRKRYAKNIRLTDEEAGKLFQAAHPLLHRIKKHLRIKQK